MIDTVELHIPVKPAFIKKTGKTVYEILGDVADYELKPSSRYVAKLADGTKVPYEIYHAYESLPTSHSGIGFKFMHRTNRCVPHVILNCSIAKIMQGHNVYGSLNMLAGVVEMLGVFCDVHPKFCAYLDFAKAEITRFDVTLPVQTQSQMTAERVRDYLRHVDWGRYRNMSVRNKRLNYNTLYFGSEKSKVGGFKLYCKGVELSGIVDDIKRKAKQGCLTSMHKLKNVFTNELIHFANKSVRIEVTVKKREIKNFDLPTNLWQFLIYQLNNPNIYQTLFNYKTADFMTALKGITMTHTDDIQVYDLLHSKLTTITATGKLSTTRAKHAYNFYKRLKDDGFYEVKRTSSKATFCRNVKSLVDAGFSRAYLQNLTKNEDIPILRLLNLDFNAPLPKSYKEPVSHYLKDFEQYLTQAINVA